MISVCKTNTTTPSILLSTTKECVALSTRYSGCHFPFKTSTTFPKPLRLVSTTVSPATKLLCVNSPGFLASHSSTLLCRECFALVGIPLAPDLHNSHLHLHRHTLLCRECFALVAIIMVFIPFTYYGILCCAESALH